MGFDTDTLFKLFCHIAKMSQERSHGIDQSEATWARLTWNILGLSVQAENTRNTRQY